MSVAKRIQSLFREIKEIIRFFVYKYKDSLSSPRAQSTRAVTGRRCPHSGKGEDFLTGQPDFFTETAVTSERKVEKLFPKTEINRHAED